MKTIKIEKYICDVCGQEYQSEERALKCESHPITHDRGVKRGDIVLITGGEGSGRKAIVTQISIADMDYGHYAWEMYWHTPLLIVDILNDYGSRVLTFDQYETLT